jgi:hypothetical protein
MTSAVEGVLSTHRPLLDNDFCAYLCGKAGSAARHLACRKDRKRSCVGVWVAPSYELRHRLCEARLWRPFRRFPASRAPDVRVTQLHWTLPPAAAKIGFRQGVSSLCLKGRGGPSQVAKLGRTAPGVSTPFTSRARRPSVGFSRTEAPGGHVLLRGSPAAF